jgi:hypothetical protein
VSISYTYELPFGRGKTFGGNINRFADIAAGGWQVAGITTLRTGEHYTAFLGNDQTRTGTSAMPNMIHNPRDFSFNTAQQAADGCDNPGHQTLVCWYNPAAFVVPPLAPGQQLILISQPSRISRSRKSRVSSSELSYSISSTIPNSARRAVIPTRMVARVLMAPCRTINAKFSSRSATHSKSEDCKDAGPGIHDLSCACV